MFQEKEYPPQWVFEYQLKRGHAPWFDNQGRFGGFKSRPGAPQAGSYDPEDYYGTTKNNGRGGRTGTPNSPRDGQSGLGIVGEIGSQQHNSAWDSWFRKPSSGDSEFVHPAGRDIDPGMEARPGDWRLGASGANSGINPHVDPVGAAIANNSNWLRSNGITVPILPAPLPPAPNIVQFPNGINPKATGGESASAWANIQTGNSRLYEPADTQTMAPAAIPESNWNRTGWNGPTQPVTTGNYTSPYGSASVNFGGSNPALPASNKRWGWNTAA